MNTARGPLRNCSITLLGSVGGHPAARVRDWVANLGGVCGPQITPATTHLVVPPEDWRNSTQLVLDAQVLIENRRSIKIVSTEWLEDSLLNSTKKKEGPYILKRCHKSSNAGLNQSSIYSGPRSHSGLLAEVFHESTDKYADPGEIKKLEKKIEEERRIRRELEEEEKREKEAEKTRKRQQQAELFAKGSKKARNEIFSGKATCHFAGKIFY